MTPHPICHTMALLKYSYLIRPKNAFHYTAQSCYFPIFCLVYSNKVYRAQKYAAYNIYFQIVSTNTIHIVDLQLEVFMLVEHMQIFRNQNVCKPRLDVKSVLYFIYVLGLSVGDQGYAP
jgi:hypothetical protein